MSESTSPTSNVSGGVCGRSGSRHRANAGPPVFAFLKQDTIENTRYFSDSSIGFNSQAQDADAVLVSIATQHCADVVHVCDNFTVLSESAASLIGQQISISFIKLVAFMLRSEVYSQSINGKST